MIISGLLVSLSVSGPAKVEPDSEPDCEMGPLQNLYFWLMRF